MKPAFSVATHKVDGNARDVIVAGFTTFFGTDTRPLEIPTHGLEVGEEDVATAGG